MQERVARVYVYHARIHIYAHIPTHVHTYRRVPKRIELARMQLVALPRANRRNELSGPRSITRVYATTHTPARTFTFTPAASPTLRPFAFLHSWTGSTGPPPLTAPPPTRLLHPLFRRAATRREDHPPCITLYRETCTRVHAHVPRVRARSLVRSHTSAAAVRGERTNAETRPQGMGTCNCVNGTMADGPSLESPAVETRFWLTPEFYHSAAALFTCCATVAPLLAREIATTAETSLSFCFDYLLFFK